MKRPAHRSQATGAVCALQSRLSCAAALPGARGAGVPDEGLAELAVAALSSEAPRQAPGTGAAAWAAILAAPCFTDAGLSTGEEPGLRGAAGGSPEEGSRSSSGSAEPRPDGCLGRAGEQAGASLSGRAGTGDAPPEDRGSCGAPWWNAQGARGAGAARELAACAAGAGCPTARGPEGSGGGAGGPAGVAAEQEGAPGGAPGSRSPDAAQEAEREAGGAAGAAGGRRLGAAMRAAAEAALARAAGRGAQVHRQGESRGGPAPPLNPLAAAVLGLLRTHVSIRLVWCRHQVKG